MSLGKDMTEKINTMAQGEVLKDKNGNAIQEPCKCKYCGEVFDSSLKYNGNKDNNECFSCWFWDGIKNDDSIEPNRVVIVDGHHYRYRDDVKFKEIAGFAGHEFHIKFNDRREVTTRNLWHQGKIPEYWLKDFPDNAIFIGR